jgi:hypothetical protein
MTDENVTPDNTEALAPQHTVAEGTPVTDPAEDFEAPTEVPADHDDVDVALQDGKETQDGPGDDEAPESDFVGYADPAADKQEDKS